MIYRDMKFKSLPIPNVQRHNQNHVKWVWVGYRLKHSIKHSDKSIYRFVYGEFFFMYVIENHPLFLCTHKIIE